VLGAATLPSTVHGADVARAPGYRDALVELAVLVNAALGAHTLQKEIEMRGNASRVAAAFGVCDLATRRVWAPTGSDGMRTGLSDAPANLDALRALGLAAAGSERIHKRLAG
jgi:carbonic anhydrase